MEIAVTGAGGRLGHEVSRAVVRAGHQPRRIDVSAGGADIRADLRNFDEAVSALADADAVIHLAAHPKPLPDRTSVVYNDNTTIAFNVLAAVTELGIPKAVVISSINAIGGEFSEIVRYDRFPVGFGQLSQARDEYSFSKWVLEQQVEYFGRVQGEPSSLVCLRVHAVQPREVQERAYRVSPARGRRNLWGYSPPEETAVAIVRAAERPLPGVHFGYLVSTHNAMGIDTRELLRTDFPDTPCDQSIQGTRGLFDTSFAEAELSWQS
ncbi:NAD-dependent epimerase/dehydratase family protein [Ruania zhangjianzhongii]|uniref:NAD-dependent epimerase/dehydratase family protein n=1 Tax=Ruania zhangjianzhongii TaxID=2603206 RepID=UPI00143D85D2|nr:NAD(P)-dependent oxidoreductase [Ruania zhangjianzhongii]